MKIIIIIVNFAKVSMRIHSNHQCLKTNLLNMAIMKKIIINRNDNAPFKYHRKRKRTHDKNMHVDRWAVAWRINKQIHKYCIIYSSNQNVQVLLETWLEILPFHLPLCNHSCLRFSHQSHSHTEISHPEVHVEERLNHIVWKCLTNGFHVAMRLFR